MSGMSQPQTAERSRGARTLHWWLRDRRTGRIVTWQWPNPAILTALLSGGVARLDLWPSRTDELRWVSAGALTVWAADELLRGVNPMRRVLGGVVLAATVAAFVR
jgi:hypothetical protein